MKFTIPTTAQVATLSLVQVSDLIGQIERLDSIKDALRTRASVLCGAQLFQQQQPQPLATKAGTRAIRRRSREHRPTTEGFPVQGVATITYLAASHGYARLELDGRAYRINGNADPKKCQGMRLALHRSVVGSTFLLKALAMPEGKSGTGTAALTRVSILEEEHPQAPAR